MPRKRATQQPGRPPKSRRTPGSRRSSSAGETRLILFGRHAVEAALRNSSRTIHTIYAAARYESFVHELRPAVPFAETETDAIRNLLPQGAVHQDIAAHVAPLEQPALETLLSTSPKGPIIMLDQVTDPHNIGAIFRTCAAFGAAALIMQEKHAPKETGTLARAASGALEMVPWISAVNLARSLETLAEAGYWSIGLSGAADRSLEDSVSVDGKMCLVLGAEGAGLRQNIEKHCDTLAKLDINPQMESLNVSNAAAVSLYILARALKA